LRGWLRGRRSGRHAALTIVHNESVFLPLWLRYYSRFFAPADIYVLDHQTTDGSTTAKGFRRIPVRHDTIDHRWMVEVIERQQHKLLRSGYEAVLVTDVDEIVAPHPSRGTLGEYLDRFDDDFVNCRGYELIHRIDREPPIDLARPVLDQRGFWFANDIYDKPAIASVPMQWKPGFHRGIDGSMRPDPDLYLIHLHRMDYEICLARHELRREREWNEHDVSEGWAQHNRITEDTEFRRWFYEDSNTFWSKVEIEPIPPEWRGVF
jgi:hypothetical protein